VDSAWRRKGAAGNQFLGESRNYFTPVAQDLAGFEKSKPPLPRMLPAFPLPHVNKISPSILGRAVCERRPERIPSIISHYPSDPARIFPFMTSLLSLPLQLARTTLTPTTNSVHTLLILRLGTPTCFLLASFPPSLRLASYSTFYSSKERILKAQQSHSPRIIRLCLGSRIADERPFPEMVESISNTP